MSLKKGTLKRFTTPQNIKLMDILEFKDQFMTLTTDEDGDEKYVFKNLDGDNLNTICKGSVPGDWAKEQIEDGHITHVLVSFDMKDGKNQSPRGISMIKVDRKSSNIKIYLLCNTQIHRMRTKNSVIRPTGKNLMTTIIELANFMRFKTITLDALDTVVSYYAYVYGFVPTKKNQRGVDFKTELKQLMTISKTLKGEIERKDIGRRFKGHQPGRYTELDRRLSLLTQEEAEEEGYSGTGEAIKDHWNDEPVPMKLDLKKLRKKIKKNNTASKNNNNNNNNNTAKKNTKTMKSKTKTMKSKSKSKSKTMRSRSKSNSKSKTMRSKSNSKTKKRKRRSKSNDL